MSDLIFRKFFDAVALIIYTFNLKAQISIECQIVFEDDTITVDMIQENASSGNTISFSKLQNTVRYIDALGGKRKLKPHEAKEIRFTYEGEEIRMLSIKDDLMLRNPFSKSKSVFLRLNIDGYLKLFQYYGNTGGYNVPIGPISLGYKPTGGNFILQKGNGYLKTLTGLSFKRSMAKYFSDCPDLSKKIKDKEFTVNDLALIVQFYNKNCK